MAGVRLGSSRRKGVVAIAALVGALGFAFSRQGYIQHDGFIRLELTAPIHVALDGPAVCMESPGSAFIFAADPFRVGEDELTPSVGYGAGQAWAVVGVNSLDGYRVSPSSTVTADARSYDWLDGQVSFQDLRSQTGWIGGVFKGPDAAGSITWRCDGVGSPLPPDGGVGG